MIHSIRLKLTVWYLGILAVILCLFSFSLYLVVASSQSRDLDQTLALQADAVADSIFAFWRAERAASGSGPGNWFTAPAATFHRAIQQGELPDLIGRWADKTGALRTERSVRLIGASGQPLGFSSSFTQPVLPLTDPLIAQVRQGHTVYKTFTLPAGRLRLVTRPVMQAHRVLYYVQAAASLRSLEEARRRLCLWLLALIPATLAATGAVSLFLTTTALGPIRRIVAQTRRFNEEFLHEPLDAPQTRNELEQLDATFNTMLTRLEHDFRRLRQFSAAGSHELRTSLTVMKGEISVALRKPRSADEYRRVLETHLDAVDDMTSTVEELLELARSEAVEERAASPAIELGTLAQQVQETFQTMACAKGVRVDVSTDGPVLIPGNARLLERLVVNLVDNAMKHTPADGRITVRVERREDGAYVIVQDTGPGIPPEELPHLFEQFFKRRTATNGLPSTGLGLGLCRWIAEAHRGTIEVASSPGHGATFTVRFPLPASSASAA